MRIYFLRGELARLIGRTWLPREGLEAGARMVGGLGSCW